ncbi:response regulator [Tropicimonas sp. IMCC34011]|uniref:response regulator n=1 Tax=Tropicimonas sp. IMCC34011 TaxID=2248759 RepID=UPI000E262AEB|nr:response regulator [Tropicimonas sp. IMCC34011]
MTAQPAILYVEDEIIIALDTAQTLEEMGFSNVVVAHTLDKARRLAAEQSFEIALLDINLGGGEISLDFGIELRERGTNVIFASGYNSDEMRLENPGCEFIEKPLTRKTIRDAVVRAESASPVASA